MHSSHNVLERSHSRGTWYKAYPLNSWTTPGLIYILLIKTKGIVNRSSNNPIKKSGYSCRDRLLFLAENIHTDHTKNSPTRPPPTCSWPLHGTSFSNRHPRYILLSPVYDTFIDHWHYLRARRIWLARRE